MNFRLLQTGYKSAAENMAIDEAVLESISTGNSPATLRFYGWTPAAISIGYFQSLEEEVDLAHCKELGIDFVRRITGGGAVFHEHEITYSIHIPESAAIECGVPLGILESYEKICGGILRGLASLGLAPKFVPLNDIVLPVGETFKKISGNAQTRKRGTILQHGTILLKVDVDKMFSLLKVPDEKMKGKLIENVKQRVTGLSDVLGRELSFEESLGILKGGFAGEFSGCKFIDGELTAAEISRAKELVTEKYGSNEWTKKR